MRAAVVGGGVFGATTAVDLAREGMHVDLFERCHDLLLGASRANQGRLHAGYHYPRSPSTVRGVSVGSVDFAVRFPGAVRRDQRHHYLVAKGSRTSSSRYLAFCDENNLRAEVVDRHPLVRTDTVDLALRVSSESFVDLRALRHLLRQDLLDAEVRLHLGVEAVPRELTDSYDWVVDATYGHAGARPLRFEVCEIALVRLGAMYAGQSFVVMDGPYVSLDPLVGTDLHMLYDVEHSVHHVSERPDDYPAGYAGLVDRGVRYTPLTRVARMEQTAREFLRGVGMPEYRGSMFTVRAVLPDVDDTDDRPTIVARDANLVTVFAGKIATAVSAARTVACLARETPAVAA